MNIYIKSFTAAQKAFRTLQRNGIRCTLARGFGSAGCGFVLRITDKNTDKAEVCALLDPIGVNCGIL